MANDWGKTFFKVCRPRSRLTGSQWADKFRYVAPGTSPEPGDWRTDRVPYLREPMDAATDKVTERVVMMFSSQVGKSEALLNIMGYYVDQEPAPQLFLQPTIEAAENFSKERIEPTFQYSPGLRDKLEEGKEGRGTSRKKSTTIRMKHYPGGYIALVGANSPAGLASRPIRVLLADEIDRYGVTKEGSPLKLAIQRTTNFHNKKHVFVSTPTIKGASEIEKYYLESDQRIYMLPCPHCGAEFEYKWEYVVWDKDENGEALPLTARIVCPHCGEAARGAYRPDPDILACGRWVPQNPGAKSRGYHINSLCSPWVNLYELVQEFLLAVKNKDKDGLMEFVNLKLGETWDEALTQDDWNRLYNRRENYPIGTLPPGVLILTCGVDVQHTRLEATVYGWGVGKEMWGIEHHIFYGSPESPETWGQLDSLLMQKYKLFLGPEVTISCTCVDSGDGSYTNEVYRYTVQRERMRVFSIKGRGGIGVPFISLPTKNNAVGATLFNLGVDSGKSIFMNRLKIEEPGPGYVHYDAAESAGFTDVFFKQLTAEVFKQTFERGRVKMEWIKIRPRNEALDCAIYGTAAIELLNPNFEYLEEFYARGGIPSAPKKAKRPHSKGVSL